MPLSQLPNEVLAMIFEYASDTEAPFTAITLSHVCGQWRQLALQTSGIWSNTQSLTTLHAAGQAPNDYIKAVLELCARCSGDRLKFVDLAGLTSRPAQLREFIATVRRSARTLVQLVVSDLSVPDVPQEEALDPFALDQPDLFSFDSSELVHPEGLAFAHDLSPLTEEIVQLVSEAGRLRVLSITLTLRSNDEHFGAAPLLPPPATLPRLRELYVVLVMDVWVPGGVDSGLLAWLSQIASRLQHFACIATSPVVPAIQWSWDTMRRNAEGLCSATIDIPPPITLDAAAIQLPLLSRLTLSSSIHSANYADSPAWSRPTWLVAPALQELRTFATLADKIECSDVGSACLIVSSATDFVVLHQRLVKWPHLRCLTIQLETDGPLPWGQKASGDVNTARLQQVLELLIHIDNGAVPGPSLEHLGIVFRLAQGEEALGRSAFPSAQWAEQDWSVEEQGHRYQQLYGADTIQGARNPWLTAALAHLEAARRNFAAHGASPVVPIQSIKLAGLRISHEVLQTLLTECQAQVRCYPALQQG